NTDFGALIDKSRDVLKGTLEDSVLEVRTAKKQEDLKKAYNISDKQLNASKMPGETESSLLNTLAIERSALLVLENSRVLFSLSIAKIPSGAMIAIPATLPIISIRTTLPASRRSTDLGTSV